LCTICGKATISFALPHTTVGKDTQALAITLATLGEGRFINHGSCSRRSAIVSTSYTIVPAA